MANINIRPRAAVAERPPAVAPPSGNTRLGLHVTSDELAIWQTRSTSGPYKTAGDVSTNSPGDWDTIVSNSAQTLSADRWAGYTGAGCVPNSASLGGILPQGDYIRDAAFRYLVTGTTSYRTAVLTELVAQAGVAGVDFTNSSKWCVIATNADNFFRPALWLCKYIFAWDYILAGDQAWGNGPVNSGNQATIEAWLLGGANYFAAIYNTTMGLRFQDRLNDDYTIIGGWVTNCATDWAIPWYGATSMKIGPGPSNRDLSIILPAALLGVQQNNATLKSYGARAFKEYIWYLMWADNTPLGDMDRWDTGAPCLGLVYTLTSYGTLAMIADALARTGDTSLYDFSTSTGACGTAGGPKTYLGGMNELAKMIDHTYLRYGTSTAGNNGNAAYLIDTNDGVGGGNSVLDHVFSQPNLYYQSTYIKELYMRTGAGQNGYTLPAYPASPATGGYYAWGNAWGIEPATMLMFGQMEGQVDPFP